MSIGSADYLVVGDWNARCDRCGKKMKGSQLMTTWQGYKVCPEHWEPRQPQDFVRGITEHPTPPFVRDPPWTWSALCTPNGRTAIAGFAVAGCVIPGFVDPAFDPNVNPGGAF